MTPLQYAIRHDEISNQQSANTSAMAKIILRPTQEKAASLIAQLTVKEDGSIERTPANRLKIRKIIALFRKDEKLVSRMSFNQFVEGEELININVDEYIQWQRK